MRQHFQGLILLLSLICIASQALAQQGEGWIVKERLLHPNCFTVEWLSSDNFQEYEERFGIKDIERFREFPGEFFGREITEYLPIKPSWNDEEAIALIQAIETCSPVAFEYSSKNEQIYIKKQTEYGTYEQAYKILEVVNANACNDLAPNIGGACIEAYRIRVGKYSGGSIGWDIRQGTYGLFELPDAGLSVVPLLY